MTDFLFTTNAALRGAMLSAVGLAWVICLVRLVGTRTLSKMTAFDFLVTLATASLLASACVATGWSSFFQPIAAITTLILAQLGLAFLRRQSKAVRHVMENEPLLLVRDGCFLDGAMRHARVSRDDIMAKLRAANVNSLTAVSAVVLETTGDISVLRNSPLEDDIMADVRKTIGD